MVLGLASCIRIDQDEGLHYEKYPGVVKTTGPVGANFLASVFATLQEPLGIWWHYFKLPRFSPPSWQSSWIGSRNGGSPGYKGSRRVHIYQERCLTQLVCTQWCPLSCYGSPAWIQSTGETSAGYNVRNRAPIRACVPCVPILRQAGVSEGLNSVNRHPIPPPSSGNGGRSHRRYILNDFNAMNVQYAIGVGIVARALWDAICFLLRS